MKTMVLERDAYGDGEHRYHSGFLDYSKHSGFIIKLRQPCRTNGKVERVNDYLRRSFYVPPASHLTHSGKKLDVLTANVEVTHWLRDVPNVCTHGTTKEVPAEARDAAPARVASASARRRRGGPTAPRRSATRSRATGVGGEQDRAAIAAAASAASVRRTVDTSG